MSWKEQVGGGFAYMTASYASHPLDNERAFDLLQILRREQISWSEVNLEFRAYLSGQGANTALIEEQMAIIEGHLRPWLTGGD